LHFMILSIVYSSFLEVKGKLPQTKAYKITPRAQISIDGLISIA